MDEVVRVGDNVSRPAGYWTPTVHALLSHLQAQGFNAPRALWHDSERELVSFLPGETPGEDPGRWTGDSVLASVGLLLRQYHDAVASFVPPAGARWQESLVPMSGTIVCHNDFCRANVVFQEERAVGIIDFDFAHPSETIWDVASAVWHWVPLFVGTTRESIVEARWPARLRLFADSYGLSEEYRSELLPTVVELTLRMRSRALAAIRRQRRLGGTGGVSSTTAVWPPSSDSAMRSRRLSPEATSHRLENERAPGIPATPQFRRTRKTKVLPR